MKKYLIPSLIAFSAVNSYATYTSSAYVDLTTTTYTGLYLDTSSVNFNTGSSYTITPTDSTDLNNGAPVASLSSTSYALIVSNNSSLTINNNSIYGDDSATVDEVETDVLLNKYAYSSPYKTLTRIESGSSMTVTGDNANVYVYGSSNSFRNLGTLTVYGAFDLSARLESGANAVTNIYGGLNLYVNYANTGIYLKEGTTLDLNSSEDSTAGSINLYYTSGNTTSSIAITVIDDDVLENKIFDFIDSKVVLNFTFSNATATAVTAATTVEGSNINIGTMNYKDNSTVNVSLQSTTTAGGSEYKTQMATINGITFNTTNSTTSSASTTTAYLNLTSFANDLMCFEDFENYNITQILTSEYASCYLLVDGNYVLVATDTIYNENYYFEFSDAGFLNYVTAAVPEPSTYAAIFGALALSLAIYRRRK